MYSMASAEGGHDSVGGSEADTMVVSLMEEDIPGAALPEPFESHTVTELRWWLLCRGITVPTSWKKAQVVQRVRETAQASTPIVDVDGSYLYRKQQQQGAECSLSTPLPLPARPITGWEPVTSENVNDMATKVPRVTPGLLYTYLASGTGRKETHGAFRALQRGYTHWASGRLDRLEVNLRHPEYCHVRCNMTPSMKAGLYHVYLLLGKEGELGTIRKATCECAAGESASCTHISGLLHALVAMSPPEVETVASTALGSEQPSREELPITSFSCQWNVPRKRKESTAKFEDVSFKKHVYGRPRKHTLSLVGDFDPRPTEHRGTAPAMLESFLKTVKGKGLGVSILFDKDTQVWKEGDESVPTVSAVGPSEKSQLPSRGELLERVAAFKDSLRLSPARIRQIERETINQSQSPVWFAARRFRLTASMFGRVFQRLPSTPPDSLVKELLHSRQFTSKATDWGKEHEPVALKAYVELQLRLGHTRLVAVKAGFVVCEEYPFLGASPDAYVHDMSVDEQFGLAEIKCPYKYRNQFPEDAAHNSDFCCSLTSDKKLKLKTNHQYYSQIQGQLAITNRKWCDFVVYTKKGISVERIDFDRRFWMEDLLPKLTEFYDHCLCPAIVSPVHLLGMKMHDLRVA